MNFFIQGQNDSILISTTAHGFQWWLEKIRPLWNISLPHWSCTEILIYKICYLFSRLPSFGSLMLDLRVWKQKTSPKDTTKEHNE